SCTDRSGAGGNMMMVNGSPVAGATVWQESVTVRPNTQYRFAVWITSLYPTNPARLRFAINGVIVGDDIDPGSNACNWSQFATSWSSGAVTAAVLTIVNNNVILQGNDFALDDLFFGEFDQRYDSVRVTVGARPQEPFGSDTLICPGSNLLLDARNAGALYAWQNGSTAQQQTVHAPGLYSVTISNAGCTLRDSIRVDTLSIRPIAPPAIIGFCPNESVQLRAGGGLSYAWRNGGSLLGTGPSLSVQPNATTTVELRIATQCGDRGPFTISLQPKAGGKVYLPNAFTPGKDGRNDLFRPLVRGWLDQYSFSIYNRWGQRVFYSSVPGQGWDGTFNGSPQPSGAFIYHLKAGDGCAAPYQQKGTFLLIR
ncbi:MAG: T9SS type B sorting domain-containing protein, partial [Chitinophagaceae bacterium]